MPIVLSVTLAIGAQGERKDSNETRTRMGAMVSSGGRWDDQDQDKVAMMVTGKRTMMGSRKRTMMGSRKRTTMTPQHQ
jgi:hypothetical protein